MNCCPNCKKIRYWPLPDGRKQCYHCGTVYPSQKEARPKK